MTNNTINSKQADFIRQIVDLSQQLAEQLCIWLEEGAKTLEMMEKYLLKVLKEFGATLVSKMIDLVQPTYHEPQMSCSCAPEQFAKLVRQRQAEITTLLGKVTYTRAYYLCPNCKHGFAPVDKMLQACAGSVSFALAQICALLSVQLPYEKSAELLTKLTLLDLAPNTVKGQTEQLAEEVVLHEEDDLEKAQKWQVIEVKEEAQMPEHLYLSVDGTTVNVRDQGWKEIKLGAVYTDEVVVSKKQPAKQEIKARQISYFTDTLGVEQFIPRVCLHAQKRGITQAKEVIVIGDGAHWIWKAARERFPLAIQIVDWFHASEYIHEASQVLWPQTSEAAKDWAKARLDDLWEGRVEMVIEACKIHLANNPQLQATVSYLENNKSRMRYNEYRAKGLQIGSGTIESGCKHVIGARFKQAGMRWDASNLRAVAKLRTCLLSDQWEQTMQNCSPHMRSYQRKAA